MDKITRILLLYSKLVRGERVNKYSFCAETDILPRSFDRDIEDVRLYLCEMFCGEELIYNRAENSYYLTGSVRQALEPTEYVFIERVLKDSGILRTDEFSELLRHLAGNSDNTYKTKQLAEKAIQNYCEPAHQRALLKIHSDLATTISNQSVIKLKYSKANGEEIERELIPCELKCDLGYLYLVAYRQDDKEYPEYYRLDRIHSFFVERQQNRTEYERVRNYLTSYSKGITQMYGGEFTEVLLSCKSDYYPYIHDKFRDVEVVEDKADTMVLRLNVFSDGFVKWIMSQNTDFIQVIEPEMIKSKITAEAQRLLAKYTEV